MAPAGGAVKVFPDWSSGLVHHPYVTLAGGFWVPRNRFRCYETFQ
jgi:hypothetical protein